MSAAGSTSVVSRHSSAAAEPRDHIGPGGSLHQPGRVRACGPGRRLARLRDRGEAGSLVPRAHRYSGSPQRRRHPGCRRASSADPPVLGRRLRRHPPPDRVVRDLHRTKRRRPAPAALASTPIPAPSPQCPPRGRSTSETGSATANAVRACAEARSCIATDSISVSTVRSCSPPTSSARSSRTHAGDARRRMWVGETASSGSRPRGTSSYPGHRLRCSRSRRCSRRPRGATCRSC